MNLNRQRRSAFTLIEPLLVLVIMATDQFEVDLGHYPTDAEGGLQALVNPPASSDAKSQQYMKEIPKDPWGNPYQYKTPGTHNPKSFDIYSTGPDGREGGDDIGNWTEDAK